MTDISSGWRDAESSPVTFWKQIEIPLWVLDSPSLQRFPAFFIKPKFRFLGNRGCPTMLSFAALLSTKECKGSASSRMSSVMPSKHRLWTVLNRPWKTPNVKDHSSVVSLPLMVGSKLVWDNDHCHGYRAAPPMHFSERVLVWRWWALSLMLVCSHAGLRVSGSCGFRHWEHTNCVCLWISQWLHPGCQHHDYPTNSCVH